MPRVLVLTGDLLFGSSVHAGVRAHGQAADPLELDRYAVVLGAPKASRARDRRRLGSDQRQQPALQRALVHLHLVADLEAVDHVEQRLQRDALGVEQQLLRRRVALADGEDAEVSEHLALVRQERRVATFAHAQVRELVGHLPVEELDRTSAA